MRTVAALLTSLVVVCAVACGGSKSSTTPSTTVTSITFGSSTDLLKIKESFGFAATANHSDGSSVAVSDWRSDNTTVATVDTSGRVTGAGAGSTTIIATHDGMTGTRLVRVVPDFGGTWNGLYTLTGCTATGDFLTIDACSIFAVGTSNLPVIFTLRQDRDTVTGTMALGDLSAPVNGTYSTNGHIALSGQWRSNDLTGTLTTSGTDVYANAAGQIAGTFAYDMTMIGATGSAHIVCTINSMAKGAFGPAFHVAPAVRDIRTLHDWASALGIRR